MDSIAFVAYLFFAASWFVHLAARFPLLGALRLDLVLMCVITLAAGLSPTAGDPSPIERRTSRALLFIIGWAVVSIPFVEWPGSVVKAGIPNFLKACVFYYFTARLLTTRSRLVVFLTVFVGCQLFRVVEPWYLHMTTGYWGSFTMMTDWTTMNRLAGAPSDIVNPNGLAFIIVTALPFLHYLGSLTPLGALIYLASLPVLIHSLLLTGSRSGLLGFAVVVASIWLKSRRKVLISIVLASAAVVVVSSLSDDLSDRYRSMIDADARNGRSAQSRVTAAVEDLRVALRRPLFGHGLGTSLEVNVHYENGRDQPSHTLYGEVAQELGLVGVLLVVAFISVIATNVSTALDASKDSGTVDPLFVRLRHALQVWLWMDILFSFASYGLSSYEWYLTAGLAQVLRRQAAVDEALETAPARPGIRRGLTIPLVLGVGSGPSAYEPGAGRP